MADLIPAFPYPLANGPGNIPDADQVMANWEHLRDWLNDRFGNATDKQLWVADASGRATPRTISGDVTVSNTGVVSIGTGKIVAALIAALAVTNGKIADDTIQNGKLNLSTTESIQSAATVNLTSGSWADLISVTPSAGTYLFIATMVVQSNVGSNAAWGRFSNDSDTSPRSSVPVVALGTLSTTFWKVASMDGATAIKVQGQKNISGGSASDIQSLGSSGNAVTRLLRIRIGPQ